jgi:hypothetical protein
MRSFTVDPSALPPPEPDEHTVPASYQDGGSNAPTWTSWGGTLAFSATYN